MQEEFIIRLYCDIDEFCKKYFEYCKSHLLSDNINETNLYPNTSMTLSEIMTITIHFHQSGYRCFKWYYQKYVCKYLRKYFTRLLSYNRFVEIMQFSLPPMLLYALKFRVGKCSGISFIDSTAIKVCHNRRIYSHKVFKDLAQRGKTSTGWFYGFKLHLVINDKGEILSFCFTAGNIDDRDVGVIDSLSKELFGKLFADRGYISQKLFERLFSKSITLITKIKKNMKNKLMYVTDKILLRKRAVIESVNDFLKNQCQIEHTRHRSFTNFIVNLVSGLIAYSFIPKKPSLKINNILLSANI